MEDQLEVYKWTTRWRTRWKIIGGRLNGGPAGGQ